MKITAGNLIHSPHDLVAFLEGEFGSWMDRLYLMRDQLPAAYTLPWDGLTLAALTPDAPTEDQELAAKRGSAHEAQYVQDIREHDGDLVEIPHDGKAVQRTMTEMKAGRSRIYQGCLAIVVGSPRIMMTRCQTVEQMRMVNLYCRIAEYPEELATRTTSTSRASC